MIPEDDRGPVWLRGYAAIETDLQGLEDVTRALTAEVAEGFGPHLEHVTAVMTRRLPDGGDLFPELRDFLRRQTDAQSQVIANAVNFAPGTTRVAAEAREAGRDYRLVDAGARSRLAALGPRGA